MTKSVVICGIDPGLNGAFAFLNVSDATLQIVDMPTVPGTNGKRFVDPVGVGTILRNRELTSAFLEGVHASPQMGVTSAFSFGRSSGIILGALGALDVAATCPIPSVWKRAMGCTSDKKQTAERASQLMSNCRTAWKLVKNVDRAEAALLALYGAVQLGYRVTDLKLKED